MAKSRTQIQRERRQRRDAERQEYSLFLFELVDRLPDYGITLTWGLKGSNFNFHWDQTPDSHPEAYAELEAWCQERGHSFAPIMADLQRAILSIELPKLGLQLAGPGTWTPKKVPAKVSKGVADGT